MAAGFRFVCSGCDHNIEAWDEGNPSCAKTRPF